MRDSVTTYLAVLVPAGFLAAPLLAYAAPSNLSEFIGTLTTIVLLGVPFAAALMLFFWNLAQLLFTLGDAEKKKQARARVVYGIIALFVLFTIAGLVGVLQNSIFGTTTTSGGLAPSGQRQQTNPFGSGGSGGSGQSQPPTPTPAPLNPFTPPSEQPPVDPLPTI